MAAAATRVHSAWVGLLLAGLLACALAWPASASANSGRYTIGIADQTQEMFWDDRLEQLRVRHVRIAISWDVMSFPASHWERERFEYYMRRAREAGIQPLVTLHRSEERKRTLPSPSAYRTQFRRLQSAYPWVREWGTWNEANHRSQPTRRNPRRAAQFHNHARSICLRARPRCRVMAPTLLDQADIVRWTRSFQRTARAPRLWGIHNYVDANRSTVHPRRSRTAQFLRAVRGDVYFAESGGIVKFGSRYPGGRRGESMAARAITRTFRLASLSRKVKRVYFYHWREPAQFQTWDSGLVRQNGSVRPGFLRVRNEMARQCSLRNRDRARVFDRRARSTLRQARRARTVSRRRALRDRARSQRSRAAALRRTARRCQADIRKVR